ncbi:hypothetical protein [Frigoribacterium salinisoli]
MRRDRDLLDITRAMGSPRPRLVTALIGGIGLFLILSGGAVIAGTREAGRSAAMWSGTGLMVIGLARWVVEAVLADRAKSDGPSQEKIRRRDERRRRRDPIPARG